MKPSHTLAEIPQEDIIKLLGTLQKEGGCATVACRGTPNAATVSIINLLAVNYGYKAAGDKGYIEFYPNGFDSQKGSAPTSVAHNMYECARLS